METRWLCVSPSELAKGMAGRVRRKRDSATQLTDHERSVIESVSKRYLQTVLDNPPPVPNHDDAVQFRE